MFMRDFAYDGPIFLVPLSLSYPSSPLLVYTGVRMYAYRCNRPDLFTISPNYRAILQVTQALDFESTTFASEVLGANLFKEIE